jgi:uncharacterized OsmC-like protein
VRGIKLEPEAISATAEGTNEMRDRIPILTHIHVTYDLRVPADTPLEKVERALLSHVDKCPTAQSLKGAVEITWSVAGGALHSGESAPGSKG